MRRHSSVMAAIGAAFVMGSAGCGGGGGGSSSPGGGGGNNNVALSANITVVGGTLVTAPGGTTTAGATQNIVVADSQNNNHTLTSVYSPDAVPQENVTVIKAGTVFLAGHYTSTSATYTNNTNLFTASIPLTATGALAQDTVVPTGICTIRLPIDTIGNLSFPNGITVTGGVSTFNVFQNDTLTFTASIPRPSNQANVGHLTFTGSGSPQCQIGVLFATNDQSSTLNAISTIGSSPAVVTSTTAGSATTFTNASVNYTYSD